MKINTFLSLIATFMIATNSLVAIKATNSSEILGNKRLIWKSNKKKNKEKKTINTILGIACIANSCLIILGGLAIRYYYEAKFNHLFKVFSASNKAIVSEINKCNEKINNIYVIAINNDKEISCCTTECLSLFKIAEWNYNAIKNIELKLKR